MRERRESVCVGVGYSRDLSTAAFFLLFPCVCVYARVSKGGGPPGTPPAQQQVVCVSECVLQPPQHQWVKLTTSCIRTPSPPQPHTHTYTNRPLVAMATHLEEAPKRGAHHSSSRSLLSSLLHSFFLTAPLAALSMSILSIIILSLAAVASSFVSVLQPLNKIA